MTIMKLRYFIPTIAAALTMMVGCSEDNDPHYLDAVRVSSSYVSLDVNGGSTSIKVTANGDWAFSKIFDQVTKNADGSSTTTKVETPSWLKVSQLSGGAGETEITFTADKTLDGRNTSLQINCGGKTQEINVIQGLSTVSNATCKEVIDGPDSKTYRVTGTCTAIANTSYGNWYLTDETGQIYIYGTLDKAGKEKNFLSLGIEVGDIVTVEGPKTTYGTTVELVNVTVVSIQKSLIKVDSLSIKDGKLPLEGGDIVAYLTCKGNGVSVEVPEDAKDWLAISSIKGNGVPTVTFHANRNEGGDRSTTVVFKTYNNGREYTSELAISQEGAIIDATIAEFNAAQVGNTQYRIKGVISKVDNASRGRFHIKDFSGETYVYNLADFESKGVKEGDIVTVVGKRDQYNETIELTSGVIEDITFVEEVSIAEFLAKPDSKDAYYKVTGTVKDLLSDKGAENDYGNLHITDGTNDLYVYGCYPGYGATGDARKGFVKAANIEVGDQLTMIGYKSTYNGLIELCGGIYFSHEKAK